jgi:hypothetical protein
VSYPYFSPEKSFEFAEFGVEAAIVLKVCQRNVGPALNSGLLTYSPAMVAYTRTNLPISYYGGRIDAYRICKQIGTNRRWRTYGNTQFGTGCAGDLHSCRR